MESRLFSVLMVSGLLWTLCSAETGNWTVNNCINVEMAAVLNIFPDAKDVNNTRLVEVPRVATATGHCPSEISNNQTEQLDLHWVDEDTKVNKPLDRYLNITFKVNETAPSPYYGLFRIDGYFETRYFDKNVTDDTTNKTILKQFVEYVSFTTFDRTLLELQTPLNMSYMCKDIGIISMHSEIHDSSEPQGGSGNRVPNVTFTATSVMLDAFRPANQPTNQFQAALDCSARPSDVVPIIVGCALAGTVLAVLVAYMVGRRKNRAAGYQSV
jgi:hypothetical protein